MTVLKLAAVNIVVGDASATSYATQAAKEAWWAVAWAEWTNRTRFKLQLGVPDHADSR